MGKRIVIALGGNALGNNLPEQMVAVKHTAKAIVDLIQEGHQVVVAHGNGPQVGMINIAMTTLSREDHSHPIAPMSVCTAMSQGYIGYDLQNSLREELLNRGIQKPVATVLTQVEVDPADPAFQNPSKPIGHFMTKEQAEHAEKAYGYIMKEDSGRGYRRVVASPKPVEIVEQDAINSLVDANKIVICCGGGGIPVTLQGDHLKGASAVIDKDFASCLLAKELDADMLIILTAVEKVAINFGKENEKWLDDLTVEEAQKYAGDDRNELNMVFQFEHVESGCGDYGKWTTAKYDFKEFKNIMIKWQEELQGKAWNSLFLGNHDQPRSVSRFGNDNPVYRETSAKMLATCIHMMQGTPYVYQGEELGMTNIYFDKLEDYRDIESINYFEEFTESGLMTPEHMMKCLMLRSRDNARTPMQWDDSKQAGFTEGEPWIKVNPNYKKINAAQQLEDPDSVFHYYQKLIRLRKEKDIIVYGEFEPLYREDEQIFAYTRKQDQEKLLTVCNFSDKNAEVEVPEEFKGAECLITNLGRKEFERKIVLNPYEAFVLYYKH